MLLISEQVQPLPSTEFNNEILRSVRTDRSTVEDRGSHWYIELKIGNIQPMAVSFSEPIFIGALNTSLTLNCLLYADNLGRPIENTLDLSFDTEEGDSVTLEMLIERSEKY